MSVIEIFDNQLAYNVLMESRIPEKGTLIKEC